MELSFISLLPIMSALTVTEQLALLATQIPADVQ